MEPSTTGKVYWRRSEFLFHLVTHGLVSGVVAYGQSTEGVAPMACTGLKAPVWWRTHARRHLDGLEAFCEDIGDQARQGIIEPPNPL